MNIGEIIRSCISDLVDPWESWIPAEHISRQTWQEIVARLLVIIRDRFSQLTFGLSASEISIYYHKTLGEFAELIGLKLQ